MMNGVASVLIWMKRIGEFAGASVNDGKKEKSDGDVEFNLACINWDDAKDKDDEWCRIVG